MLAPYRLWETRAGSSTPSGNPVALVHGLSGSSRWWNRNIDVLAERRLVAALDLVGFGRNRRFTRPPQILPPFPEMSTLLARWLEGFGEPVHLVGHSMGGDIAIRVAAERPELLRSLTLVDSVGIPFTFHPAAHLRPLPKPPFGGFRIARVLLPDFLRAGPTSVAAGAARILADDAREWMQRISVPTLLLWGENDPLVPLHYGEEMQRQIRGSRLVVIPLAAHVPMWDNAAIFNRELVTFFDEVESRPPASVAPSTFAWGLAGWNDGIAHRQAGHRNDIVLVHGLGMSSAYFQPLAEELFARGWNPIAPDLPGFGESANGPAATPVEHALRLAQWAGQLGIRDAVWVGHSSGSNIVANLAAERPDLARMTVCISPLWSDARNPIRRMTLDLLTDATREPARLWPQVLRAYWRCGFARWLATYARMLPDLCTPRLPKSIAFVAGTHDPLVDRIKSKALDPEAMLDLPGAHAVLFTHPRETADALLGRIATRS